MYNNGDKLWLDDEKKPYKIRACDERYLICTKPFNPKRTVLYTIIDLKEEIRGTENLVFGMGFESDEDCIEALKRLNDTVNPSEISRRNRVPLVIIRVDSYASKGALHHYIMRQEDLRKVMQLEIDTLQNVVDLQQEENKSLSEALKAAINME